MDPIKIIVSGDFKEKALLSAIIKDSLNEKGIEVSMKDADIDSLVRCKHPDLVASFKGEDTNVQIELENLTNTNIQNDVTSLVKELDGRFWKTGSPDFNKAVSNIKDRLKQILLIK